MPLFGQQRPYHAPTLSSLGGRSVAAGEFGENLAGAAARRYHSRG